MRIDFLADHPEYNATRAPPLLDYWRSALLEDTLDTRIEKLRRHLNRRAPPIAWVAHDAGEVYGIAALRVHDLDGREDLTPRLGGGFVPPAFRRRGIGAALCGAVERHAARAGIETLHPFTIDQQALYAALGWHPIERTVWRGIGGDIMVKKLNRSVSPY